MLNKSNIPGTTPNVKINISCSAKPENKTLNTNQTTFFSVTKGKKQLKYTNTLSVNTREITTLSFPIIYGALNPITQKHTGISLINVIIKPLNNQVVAIS